MTIGASLLLVLMLSKCLDSVLFASASCCGRCLLTTKKHRCLTFSMKVFEIDDGTGNGEVVIVGSRVCSGVN